MPITATQTIVSTTASVRTPSCDNGGKRRKTAATQSMPHGSSTHPNSAGKTKYRPTGLFHRNTLRQQTKNNSAAINAERRYFFLAGAG